MIGRPGAGLLQMNGQPTAQNTRECGADGDLPGFRNWDNPAHIQQLADCGTSSRDHPALVAADPRHADLPLRRAGLDRVALDQRDQPGRLAARPGPRSAGSCDQEGLLVVVQDLFLTETARARRRGAAGGGVGREDRHVHQRRPDRAPVREGGRSARRGPRRPRHLPRLRPADGLPRPRRRAADPVATMPRRRSRPGSECSARPALRLHRRSSYDELRGAAASSGRAPPRRPGGTERLYTDGRVQHRPGLLRDLRPGPDHRRAEVTGEEYRAKEPAGRAFLHAADYQPPPEVPDAGVPPAADHRPHPLPLPHPHQDRPRARARRRRARTSWVEMHPADAAALGIGEGDLVEVESARGAVRAAPGSAGIREGVVFLPFHYGYWDSDGRADDAGGRANELTVTEWDPVSKQPLFKIARSVRVTPDGGLDAPRPLPRPAPPRQTNLADAFREVGAAHRDEADVFIPAGGSPRSATSTPSELAPFAERYGEEASDEPERLHAELFAGARDRRPRPAAGPARPLPDGGRRATSPGPSSARRPQGCATTSCRGGRGLRGRDRDPARLAAYPDESSGPAGTRGGVEAAGVRSEFPLEQRPQPRACSCPQAAVMPPSIANAAPVMNLASSLSRNATNAAISSGCAIRPTGCSAPAARMPRPGWRPSRRAAAGCRRRR